MWLFICARPAWGAVTTTDEGLVLLGCSLLADARTYVPTDWCEGWCAAGVRARPLQLMWVWCGGWCGRTNVRPYG